MGEVQVRLEQVPTDVGSVHRPSLVRENNVCESVRATGFISRDDANEVGEIATLQRHGDFFLQPSRAML